MVVELRQDLKVMRIGQVIERTGLSRSTIYQRVKDGSFPKQRPLGARSVGWFKHEIDEFLLKCLNGGQDE